MKEKALDDEEAKVYQQILEKQRADDEARAVLFFLSPLSRPGPQTRPPRLALLALQTLPRHRGNRGNRRNRRGGGQLDVGRADAVARHGRRDAVWVFAVGGDARAREVGRGGEDDRRPAGRQAVAVGRNAREPDVRERDGDAGGGERAGDAGAGAVGVAAGDGVAQPPAERRGAGLDPAGRVSRGDAAGELCGGAARR